MNYYVTGRLFAITLFYHVFFDLRLVFFWILLVCYVLFVGRFSLILIKCLNHFICCLSMLSRTGWISRSFHILLLRTFFLSFIMLSIPLSYFVSTAWIWLFCCFASVQVLLLNNNVSLNVVFYIFFFYKNVYFDK